MFIAILSIVIAMLVIWRASDGFETSSDYLGRNLSDGVRGATINAIGSSMPELFTTFIGLVALKEADAFAFGIGTTAGSAIFNAMIIPAVVIIAVIMKGMTQKVEVSPKVILRDGLCLIAAEIGLIFLISGDTIGVWHAVALMGMYFIYVAILFGTMSKSDGQDEDDEDDDDGNDEDNKSILSALLTLDLEALFIRGNIGTGNAWALLLVSMTIIGAACAGLVHGCEQLAQDFGVAPYFIAVVLASAATSVPDTIISVRDAFDGDYDDAVANALGSNIFDVCFALGFPLFVYSLAFGDITMDPETIGHVAELRGMLLVLTVLTFAVLISAKGLRIIHACIFLAFYVFFTMYVLGRANDWAWTFEIAEYFQQLLLR